MNQLANRALFVASITAISATVYAAITLPHTFSPNTTAQSSQVNANFTALLNEVNALRAELDKINEVMEIKNIGPKKTVVFKNTNVNISSSEDGLGNLIMGSEFSVGTAPSVCSQEEAYLVNNGSNPQTYCSGSAYDIYGTWAAEQKTGKHNIIVGKGNSYVGDYGIIVGNYNSLIGNYGVAFGYRNIVASRFATVTGGSKNISAGPYSSISGGEENKTISRNSSVSGGKFNRVGSVSVSTDIDDIDYSGDFASISGGGSNTAVGEGSTINGGFSSDTLAGSNYSAILGGQDALSTEKAQYGAVVGGRSNKTRAQHSVAVGGRRNLADGQYSVVVGGGGASGGTYNLTNSTYSVILGGQRNRINTPASGAVITGTSGVTVGSPWTVNP